MHCGLLVPNFPSRRSNWFGPKGFRPAMDDLNDLVLAQSIKARLGAKEQQFVLGTDDGTGAPFHEV